MKKSSKPKRKRKLLLMSALLLIVCISGILTACADSNESSVKSSTYNLKVVEATDSFYVNDFANILSENEEAELMEKAVKLDESSGGIQVVVTTVENLNDCLVEDIDKTQNYGIEEISYSMFKQYGIGAEDMGILILFSSGDRDVMISTGYQMQGYITDSKSGQLLDNYAMEYFKNDQFAEGIISLQNAVISEITKVVPENWKKDDSSKEDAKKEQSSDMKTEEMANTDNTLAEKDDGSNKGKILFASILAFFAFWVITFIGLLKSFLTSKKRLNKEREEANKTFTKQREEFENQISKLKQAHQDDEVSWKKELQNYKDSANQTLCEQRAQIDELVGKNQRLNEELAKCEDRYRRIKILHPKVDFDAEIAQMLEDEYKDSAGKIDEYISQSLNLSASKDRVEVFQDAINVYQGVTDENVKKYLTSDIDKLIGLYNESLALLRKSVAQKAYDDIEEIYRQNQVGNHQNYNNLKSAYDIYLRLNSEEKDYFPDKNLIRTVKSLLDDASEDLKNFETAAKSEKKIHSIVDRIHTADEDDLDDLEKAVKIYKLLSAAQMAYMSAELINRLEKLYKDAEEDHERQKRRRREEEEREERRRRAAMSSSHNYHSSSSYHSSSFSGHGGRPSGGGASRKF